MENLEENKNEKNFNEIYDKIYNDSRISLKKAKRKANTFILAIILVCIIINLFVYLNPETKFISLGAIALSFCIIMFFIILARESYGKLYKEYIIKELAKNYNEKLYYDRKHGITTPEYAISNFDNTFDKYYSEDRIYGTLKSGANVQIAEVVTFHTSEYRDESGNVHTDKTETFRGMYGIIRLEKSVCTEIYISKDSMLNRFSKDRIEMDSSEFEKFFDCSAEDKVVAMQIFTSDLIEKYIEMRENFKYRFELKIEDNMIYFRYKCGKMFEPPVIGDGLDKETIKKYYDLIYYPLEIIAKTVENINHIM